MLRSPVMQGGFKLRLQDARLSARLLINILDNGAIGVEM